MREILSQLPEQDIKIFCNVNHLYLCQKLREEKKATLCKAVFSGNWHDRSRRLHNHGQYIITRQGPRLTWKKSGGGPKYLKSGILTLATFISAKMHFFDQSQAFLELPMHEFSESVEKPKKN